MTTPETRHGGKTVIRYVAIFVFCGLVAGFLAVYLSGRQERVWLQKYLAEARELDKHALGTEKPSPENFMPMQVVPRPPLVSEFEILDAKNADTKIDPDETVLAVAINGEARAYPLNIMTGPAREVFNDTLGGKAIAATW